MSKMREEESKHEEETKEKWQEITDRIAKRLRSTPESSSARTCDTLGLRHRLTIQMWTTRALRDCAITRAMMMVTGTATATSDFFTFMVVIIVVIISTGRRFRFCRRCWKMRSRNWVW